MKESGKNQKKSKRYKSVEQETQMTEMSESQVIRDTEFIKKLNRKV